jgi:acetylornithine deacetylase/succinyl-diaminopimelate desuccinylase-like protein
MKPGRLWALCLTLPLPGALAAQPVTTDVHDTARLLAEIIRVDTSNPPGDEAKLAELLLRKFQPLGFEIDVIPTPQEGKAHFVARLRGDGSRKPVLLAAHADVVGVEREKWTFDPFAGTIEDGFVFGRGALDFKGGLAVFARAVMMLAENEIPLTRDVIFLAEADEEGGRYSTMWLAQNHWEKIDCEFALNEGGWIIKRPDGKVRYVSISTADKSAVSLVLTARGTSTHSSLPRPDNAIFQLSKALARLADYDTEPTLIPITRQFFTALAETSEPPMSTYFRNLVEGRDPALVREADREISKNVLLHAVMRNTIAPVLLNAGFRGNVIPGSAEATLNFRTIPGTETEELIREVEAVIADPAIEVAPAGFPGMDPEQLKALMRMFEGMEPSSQETDLYRALASQAKKSFPEAEVTPWLFQAGTDAFAWRSRGVPVYGIYPYPIDDEDLSRMHGNDERVSVESLGQGTELIYRTLLEVAAK